MAITYGVKFASISASHYNLTILHSGSSSLLWYYKSTIWLSHYVVAFLNHFIVAVL